MKLPGFLHRHLILVTLCLGIAGRGDARTSQTMPAARDELFKTISVLDGKLFDSYNRCDLEAFGEFFIDDVEFYHDQGGVTLGRKNLTEAVRQNICGKVRRALVPGTLEVHPMNGYGAVEIGVHRFYHPVASDKDPTGEARFVHLWQLRDDAWKITRVISFDHRALPK